MDEVNRNRLEEFRQLGIWGQWGSGVKSLFLTLALKFDRNPVNGTTTPNPICCGIWGQIFILDFGFEIW